MTIAQKRFEFTEGGLKSLVTDFNDLDLNLFKKDALQKTIEKVTPASNFINHNIPNLKIKTSGSGGIAIKSIDKHKCKPEHKKYIKHAVGTFQKYLGYVAAVDPTGTVEEVCEGLVNLDSGKLCDIVMNPMALSFDLSGVIDFEYTAMGECLTGEEITKTDKKAVANVATGIIVNSYDKDNTEVKGYFSKLMNVLPDEEIQHQSISQALEYYSKDGAITPVKDLLTFETDYPKINNNETLSNIVDNLRFPTRMSTLDRFNELKEVATLLKDNTASHVDVETKLINTTNKAIIDISNNNVITDSTPEVPNLDQVSHWVSIYQNTVN